MQGRIFKSEESFGGKLKPNMLLFFLQDFHPDLMSVTPCDAIVAGDHDYYGSAGAGTMDARRDATDCTSENGHGETCVLVSRINSFAAKKLIAVQCQN